MHSLHFHSAAYQGDSHSPQVELLLVSTSTISTIASTVSSSVRNISVSIVYTIASIVSASASKLVSVSVVLVRLGPGQLGPGAQLSGAQSA